MQKDFEENQAILGWQQGLSDVDVHNPQELKKMHDDTLGRVGNGIDKLVKDAAQLSKDVLFMRDKAQVYKVDLGDSLGEWDKIIHEVRVINMVKGILQAYSDATDGVAFRTKLSERVSPMMKAYKFSSTALPATIGELYKCGLNLELPKRV